MRLDAAFDPAAVFEALFETIGVKLDAKDRVLLRERGIDRNVMAQDGVATKLRCSQPYVSQLEDRLIGRIRRATTR